MPFFASSPYLRVLNFFLPRLSLFKYFFIRLCLLARSSPCIHFLLLPSTWAGRRVVARATWDKNCVEFYLCLVNESLEWTVACQLIETLFITCRHLRFTIKIKVLGWKILKFHSLCFKQGQMLRVFQQWSRLIFFRSSHYPTLDLHLTKSKVPRECQMNLKTDNKWVRWCWSLIIGFENSVCIILILRFLHRMVHTEKCREQKIRCIERNG